MTAVLIVDALGARLLPHFGMHLSEDSDACATVPLLRMACLPHDRMATFAETCVSEVV